MGHNRNLADYAHHFDGTNIDLGSGNIETEGVVTYEDVTNVDAIGIVTARAGVKVPDNQKIFLGTGDDLQIYHNASDSFIVDNRRHLIVRADGTGDLYLQSDNKVILSDIGGNETFIECNDNGNVSLYYDNSKKLETTTTGATVTGTLVSDGVTSELDLSAISSSISDTAVHVFVYDTSKDSDGGAWRKRTQHTSWYNETLNTATRGSRKEFPAVAVIVTETRKVTIYDGDDPDLPMWMIFNPGSGNALWYPGSSSATATVMLNGKLANAASGGSPRFRTIDFLSDSHLEYSHTDGRTTFNINVSQRNAGAATGFNYGNVSGAGLIDRDCNDVAMTVLPNAPIDDATGLPVPTIAVGTNGGASIIKDNGTVVDITITTGANNDADRVDFTDDNRIVIQWGGDSAGEITIDEIPSADTSANYPINLPGSHYNDNSPNSYSPIFLTEGPSQSNRHPTAIQQFRAVGTTAALSLFDENKTSEEDGMVAYATTSHNTGWMQGRIKGAFLSDTDTTNATYTSVADDWATTGSWTKQSSISVSSTGSGTSGTLSITGNGTGSNVYFFNGISVEANTDYVVSVTFGAENANEFYINDTTYSTANKLLDINALSGSTRSGQFNTGSNTFLYIQGYQVSTTATTITNITIQKVSEKDRSVNNKGLLVFGTVAKSAVATGAELVAYSGFSGSNYLRHRNTTNYGNAATITMGGWSKIPGSAVDSDYRYLCSCRSGTTQIGLSIHIDQNNNANAGKPYFYDVVNSSLQSTGPRVDDNQWHHILGVLDGTSKKIYIDGELIESGTVTGINLSAVDITNVGHYVASNSDTPNYSHGGYLALIKFSASAPTAEQVKKMYEDEKYLFHENAKCTLYGSSDAVTALAYDEVTEQLHVGTSSGRSDFRGLRRINNTTTAVTTAISAHDGFIVEQ